MGGVLCCATNCPSKMTFEAVETSEIDTESALSVPGTPTAVTPLGSTNTSPRAAAAAAGGSGGVKGVVGPPLTVSGDVKGAISLLMVVHNNNHSTANYSKPAPPPLLLPFQLRLSSPPI